MAGSKIRVGCSTTRFTLNYDRTYMIYPAKDFIT